MSNTRIRDHQSSNTNSVSLPVNTTLWPCQPAPGRARWWSQTGSNRRPHACKARALPTELWPHHWRTSRAVSAPRSRHAKRMVGLGRLERPTSPLSGVRSNHLSYRPVTHALRAEAPVTQLTKRVVRKRKEKRRRRHPAYRGLTGPMCSKCSDTLGQDSVTIREHP